VLEILLFSIQKVSGRQPTTEIRDCGPQGHFLSPQMSLRWADACAAQHSPSHHKWNFIYFFYHDFAKIYGPPEILQNYTSAAMAYSVRDITPWPTVVGAASNGPLVWDRHSAVPHGVRGLAPWATALCPSAMGHGGSRPTSAMGHDARV
jgi:hypothetical protein